MGHSSQKARWWKTIEDSVVVCELCPRHCHIHEGQFGYCHVRFAKKGELFTVAHGKTSGFCVDPIEKKPLFHFLPGSTTFSFGTASCNMGCVFCQNWSITKDSWENVLLIEATPLEIANTAKENRCASVAFTYNEPIISAEFIVDTARECHKKGIRTVAVTNGYISREARADFFSEIDAANIDLKGFQESFYQEYCKASLKPVLETLEYVANHTHTWLEVTTLLIPGVNESPQEIDALTKWIARHIGPHVPLHFSAFYPQYKLSNLPPTPAATLLKARDIALKNGLHHVYASNISSPQSQCTQCANCGARLIERKGFLVTKNSLKNGACPDCGVPLGGIFARQIDVT
jgi:pyruvate formate lyase activating enzyme